MSDPILDPIQAILNKQRQPDPINDPINAILQRQQSNNTPPAPIQGTPDGLPGANPQEAFTNLDRYQMAQEAQEAKKSKWQKLNDWATKQNNTPSTFDRIGDIALNSFTTPYQAFSQYVGKGEQALGNILPDNYGGNALKNDAAKISNQINNLNSFKEEQKLGTPASMGVRTSTPNNPLNPTAAYLADEGGQLIPQVMMGEAAGLGGDAEIASNNIAKALNITGKTYPYLASVGRGILHGIIGGGAYGTQAGLTTPTNDPNNMSPEDFLSNKANQVAENTLGGAAFGGAIGGVVPAALGANGAIRGQITNNVKLPPEILTNETPGAVLSDANEQFPGVDIDRIQQYAQGDPANPDTKKAQNIISRLVKATSDENGVSVSLHDISGDKVGRQTEASLEGKPGSIANTQRLLQGRQEIEAINKLQKDQADLVGTNNPEPIIQQSLNNKYDSLKQEENELYRQRDNELAQNAPQEGPGADVDVSPVLNRIAELREQNNVSIARDPQVDALLERFETNIKNAVNNGTNDYAGIKNAVTQIEAETENLKSGFTPNRQGAKALKEISTLLDKQADTWAKPYLSVDPKTGLTSAETASNFHRDKIVPFQDSDTGIPQIMNGKYADKAVKPFFSTASPEQFSTLFNSLDGKGQNAVVSGLINNAVDYATENGKINPTKFAKYLSDRSEHISSMFNNAHEDIFNSPNLSPADKEAMIKALRDQQGSLQGLSTLIQNTPRAVSTGLPTANSGLLSTARGAKIGFGTLGYIAGGPAGAIGGPIAEMVGESALNNIRSRTLFNPDLSKYAFGERTSSIPTPKIPPSTPPPETGSLTQPPGQGGGSGPFTPVSDNLAAQKQAVLDYQAKRSQAYQDTVGVAETALNKQKAQTLQNANTPGSYRELETGYPVEDNKGKTILDREPTVEEMNNVADRMDSRIARLKNAKATNLPIRDTQDQHVLSNAEIDSQIKTTQTGLDKLSQHIENVKNGTVPTAESRLQDIQNAYDAQRDLELAKANFNKQDTASIQELNRNLQNSRTTKQALNKTQNSQSQTSTDNPAISLQPNTTSGSPAYGTPQTLEQADKQLGGLQSNLQDKIQQVMEAYKGGGDRDAAMELIHLRSIQQNIEKLKALGSNPLMGASNELDAEQNIKNSLAQKPSSIVADHQNYMTRRGKIYTTPNGETGIVPADEVEAIWSSPYLSETEKISGTSRPSGMSLSQWISELISRGKIGKGQ